MPNRVSLGFHPNTFNPFIPDPFFTPQPNHGIFLSSTYRSSTRPAAPPPLNPSQAPAATGASSTSPTTASLCHSSPPFAALAAHSSPTAPCRRSSAMPAPRLRRRATAARCWQPPISSKTTRRSSIGGTTSTTTLSHSLDGTLIGGRSFPPITGTQWRGTATR